MTTTDQPADPARPADGDPVTVQDDGTKRQFVSWLTLALVTDLIVIGVVIPAALLKYRKPGWVHPGHREPSGTP
ncbi:hypothetical protein AB0B30_01485 [Streptomyces narbonensis]|uniref:Uncharacterized protein n=1 Tax=Streptomyces narbonensis TaxID=67333 RepID=A0ABV3C437_9ACTN